MSIKIEDKIKARLKQADPEKLREAVFLAVQERLERERLNKHRRSHAVTVRRMVGAVMALVGTK